MQIVRVSPEITISSSRVIEPRLVAVSIDGRDGGSYVYFLSLYPKRHSAGAVVIKLQSTVNCSSSGREVRFGFIAAPLLGTSSRVAPDATFHLFLFSYSRTVHCTGVLGRPTHIYVLPITLAPVVTGGDT